MSYNELRLTYSKKECKCSNCTKKIYKGDEVYIKPKDYIVHKKCHKSNATS